MVSGGPGSSRFMVRWHENEATLSRKHQASIMGGVQGNGEGRGNRVVGKPIDERRKEIADRVARCQADY